MSLVTLKREIDIPTIVRWVIGIGGVLVWLTLQWARVGSLEARIAELEGGMDVKNGVWYLGRSDEYNRGAKKAFEAKPEPVDLESEP